MRSLMVVEVEIGGQPGVQLRRKAQGKELTRPELLSNRTGRSENKRADWLLDKIESEKSTLHGGSTLENFDGLIDLQKTLPM